MYHSIRPGKVWLDDKGKPIQAHGFSVFYNEEDGLYYWYGENKEFTKAGGTVWHWGVRLYTSKDLYNWQDQGLIIPPTPDDLSCPLHPTYFMDRPHILFCPKTGKFVAWLKIMSDNVSQYMAVMQADHFTGPYTFVTQAYKPLDMDSGDFCLHYDEKQGKAYIFFERLHNELICATLTDDFTALTGEYSAHYKDIRPPYTREAPTFFERNGKKYLFTSGTTGYNPNASRVCMFDDYHGEYTDLGDPCIGDWSRSTFGGQITSVLYIKEKDQYIACADRWMPGWWMPFFTWVGHVKAVRYFKDYVFDPSPQPIKPLTGKEIVHHESTYKARYVWLPIEWQGDKPVIRWRREWSL